MRRTCPTITNLDAIALPSTIKATTAYFAQLACMICVASCSLDDEDLTRKANAPGFEYLGVHLL